MCIACNCPRHGDRYLDAYNESRVVMRSAIWALSECVKEAPDASIQQRYARIHHRMEWLFRAWNQLEHEREGDA